MKMEIKVISENTKEEFENQVNGFFKETVESNKVVVDREFRTTKTDDGTLFTAFFVIQEIPNDICHNCKQVTSEE